MFNLLGVRISFYPVDNSAKIKKKVFAPPLKPHKCKVIILKYILNGLHQGQLGIFSVYYPHRYSSLRKPALRCYVPSGLMLYSIQELP